MGWVFLIVALIFNSTANILMKMGSQKLEGIEALTLSEKLFSLLQNWQLLLGLTLFASNVIFYTLALRKINLSVAYPIMSSGGVLVIALVSALYLSEKLNGMQMLGIGMIAVGIFLVTYYLEA